MNGTEELSVPCEHGWEVVRVTLSYNGREPGYCKDFTLECKRCKTEELKTRNE